MCKQISLSNWGISSKASDPAFQALEGSVKLTHSSETYESPCC